MASLTEQFTKKALPPWAAHPLYHYWKSQKDGSNGLSLHVVIYRPREGLTFAPAKMYVSELLKDGTRHPPMEYSWDSVANQGLIRLGARCDRESDEVMRFALMAQEIFGSIEGRVGDAYFNSVLLERLRAEPFDKQPHLSAMLEKVIREYRADRSEFFVRCLEEIDSLIGGLSEDLTLEERLGYDSETADRILDGALAQYVDERFNVTNRALLGWQQ